MRPPGISKRDTNTIGMISECAITLRFLEIGYGVLIPYGGNQRYDMIIEDAEGKHWRIQCKSGRVDESKTVLEFSTSIRNVTGKNRQPRDYRGQCDYFAVYCAKLHKAYLIPVDEVGTSVAKLQLTQSNNVKRRSYLMASDYEL